MGTKDQMRWQSLWPVRNQIDPKCELIGGITDKTILVGLYLISATLSYLAVIFLYIAVVLHFVSCIDDTASY